MVVRRVALLAAVLVLVLPAAHADPLVGADRSDDEELTCLSTTPSSGVTPLCVHRGFFLGADGAIGGGRFAEAGTGPDGPYVRHNVTAEVSVTGYDHSDEDWDAICYDVQPSVGPVCANRILGYGHADALPHGTILHIGVGPDGPVVQAEPHGDVDWEASVAMTENGDELCFAVTYDLEGWQVLPQCADRGLLQGRDGALPRGEWVVVGLERSY